MKMYKKLVTILKPERLYANKKYYKFKDMNMEQKYLDNQFDARKNTYFLIQIMLFILILGIFVYNLIYASVDEQVVRGIQVAICLITLQTIYQSREEFLQILSVIHFVYDILIFNLLIKQHIIQDTDNIEKSINFILFTGVRYAFQLAGYMICSNNCFLQITMMGVFFITSIVSFCGSYQNVIYLWINCFIWILFCFFMLIQLEVNGRNIYFQNTINEKKHQSWKQILDEKILNSIFVVTYGNITNDPPPQIISQNTNQTQNNKLIGARTPLNNQLNNESNSTKKQLMFDKRRTSNFNQLTQGFSKNLLHFQKEKNEIQNILSIHSNNNENINIQKGNINNIQSKDYNNNSEQSNQQDKPFNYKKSSNSKVKFKFYYRVILYLDYKRFQEKSKKCHNPYSRTI